MFGNAKLSTKKLYLIMAASFLIILFSSLEVFMRVKDALLFENWVETAMSSGDLPAGYTPVFDDYVVAELFRYFFRIAIPMGFAVFSYFTYVKLRLSGIFIFVWTVLLLGGLAYTVFELNFGSIFYYLIVAAYLLLIGAVLSLSGDMENVRKK